MTYEQGGSGRAGRAIETAIGDTLTLGYRIQNHTESGLSTIESAVMHADRMLKEFSAFHRRNLEMPWGAYEGYVFPASNDAAKLAWLTSLLDANGIKYGSAAPRRKASGLDYADASQRQSVREGRPHHRCAPTESSLLQVLMDPNPELSDSLTYDITTWALPYAYGMKAYAMTSAMPRTDGGVSHGRPLRWRHKATNLPTPMCFHYDTDFGTPVLAALLKHGVTGRVWPSAPSRWVAKRTLGARVHRRHATQQREALGKTWRRLEQLTANVPGMDGCPARKRHGRCRARLRGLRRGPLDAPTVAWSWATKCRP